jgi:two-component system OmpR family sensor kinase
MALYLGGIILMSSLIFWWYTNKETRRIHYEQKISLKLYDVQCKRLLKSAPKGFECPIKKPDFSDDFDSLYRELIIAGVLVLVFGFILSFYLAFISIRPMREAVNMMDNFARSMIHDLNTPITTAYLNATALKKLNLNDQQDKRVNRIVKSLQMLQSLENRLKNAITHAKIEYEDKKLSLCKLCETLKERSPLIQLTCKEDINIIADEVMITRLLDNLISNAVKYNQNNNPVKIDLSNQKLSIIDQGKGIKHPERIFDPYYREKSSMPGLGLGLGIVKEVCEHYDIKIKVESEIAHGTTVKLDFSSVVDFS